MEGKKTRNPGGGNTERKKSRGVTSQRRSTKKPPTHKKTVLSVVLFPFCSDAVFHSSGKKMPPPSLKTYLYPEGWQLPAKLRLTEVI